MVWLLEDPVRLAAAMAAYAADPLPWNPLLTEWHQATTRGRAARSRGNLDSYIDTYRVREKCSQQYAFSVPTGAAIRHLAHVAPRIVELGAATGYWAKLLSDAGVDVVAFDHHPPGATNDYMNGQEIGTYFPVNCGDVSVLRAHADRALLLCWPPMDNTAVEAVDTWKGDLGSLVIMVGEGYGGCCATDDFFKKMEAEFTEEAVLDLPNWDGLHDAVWIYRRTSWPKTRKIELE